MREESRQWRIEYGERVLGGRSFIKAMKKLRDISPLYFRKEAISHCFLRVADPFDSIRYQFHGAALNCETGHLAPSFVDKHSIQKAFWLSQITPRSRIIRQSGTKARLFALAGDDKSPFILDYLSDPAENLHTVLCGDQDEVMSAFNKVLMAGYHFNQTPAVFSPFGLILPGQNSNTVARMGLDAIGVRDVPSTPFIRASFSRRMICDLPPLDTSDLTTEHLIGMVMKNVAEYIPESDERFRRKAASGADRPVYFRDLV